MFDQDNNEMDISSQMSSLNIVGSEGQAQQGAPMSLLNIAAGNEGQAQQGVHWPNFVIGMPNGAMDQEIDDVEIADSDDTSPCDEPPFDSPPKLEKVKVPSAAFFAGYEEPQGISILFENHGRVERYVTLFNILNQWAPHKGVLPVNSLVPNKSYVVALDEHTKECFRGKVLEIETQAGNTFVTIRNCDKLVRPNPTVKAENIFWMIPEFKRLPLKVNTCKILGFERFSDSRICKDLLRFSSMDVGTQLVILKCGVDSVNDCLVVDGICSVTLEGIEYEKLLLSALLKHILGRITRIPKTFYAGLVLDYFHLVCIDHDDDASPGIISFTIHTNWERKLGYVKPNDVQFPPVPANHPDLLNLCDRPKFLACPPEPSADFMHYRVRVIGHPDTSGQVKVLFVDFGNTETIPFSPMIPIALVDPILETIIPQVFSGHLNGVRRILDAEEYFSRIGGGDVDQRGVVTGLDEFGLPIIDLYVKIKGWAEWTYINELLVTEGLAEHSGCVQQRDPEFVVDPSEENRFECYKSSLRLVESDPGVTAHDLQPYPHFVGLY